jgi:hypothetical protein
MTRTIKGTISILAATVTLSLFAATAVAADVQVRVPSTPEAARAAELIARAEHALLSAASREQIQTLWIFPTAEAETVFVHYTTSVAGEQGATSEHLAFVEMRGARIAKVTDFTTPAPTMMASTKAGS